MECKKRYMGVCVVLAAPQNKIKYFLGHCLLCSGGWSARNEYSCKIRVAPQITEFIAVLN